MFMNRSVTQRCKVSGLAILILSGLASMTGCGMGTPVAPTDTVVPALSGMVHGGNQPVQGSYIALYATTSAGTGNAAYGASVTPIATTTTDANGDFSFSATPTCSSGQYAYLLAAGGNPGLTSGTNNQAILLMAALGPCSSVGSTGFVTINEVTTVAAAYALSGFFPTGGAGVTYSAVTGGGAVPGVTTSSANTQGLKDAFANAANIVSINTGLAYTATPNGAGAVPQGTIHALADILQNCVNSASAASSSCIGNSGSLTQAAPPTATNLETPANSLQAAIDIAQYPGNNPSKLFGLISSSPAFPTTVTTAPNDWSIGIAYNSALISSALGMTIDNYDDVWVSGSLNGDLLEYSPQGAPLSPTNTVPAVNGSTSTLSAVPAQAGWLQNVTFVTGSNGDNIRYMAFDQNNNLWMADGDQGKTTTFVDTGVLEYVPGGTPTSPTQGTASVKSYTAVNANYNTYAIAADKYGDVWTSSYKKSTCTAYTTANTGDCNVVEFVPTAYTPYASFGTGAYQSASVDGTAGSRGLAVDSSSNSPGAGNVWTTDIGFAKVGLFQTTLNASSAASASANETPITVTASTDATYGVAIDGSSNAWVVGTTTGNLYKLSPAGTVLNTYATTPAMYAPAYDVIDGNNNVFIASNVGGSSAKISTVVEFSSALGAFAPPAVGLSPLASGYAAGASGATFTSGTGLLYEATDLAIDRSGAIWVVGTGAYSTTAPNPSALVQILGVAAPTNPVLAFGQYGVKP